ncbi:hypothetical protein [Sorangium sp. So ce542]|uniref:hypothetical protein n=1 Tax=Sorangium sp. So ce542 TaxID=3133316 RepID=UPI003F631AB3
MRLDSGDLLALSRDARRLLDEAGLHAVRIVASGGLDEEALESLCSAGAPIDAFGVGTRLGMSADAPVLDMAYKIVDHDGAPRLKLGEGKETLVPAVPRGRELDRPHHLQRDREQRDARRERPHPGAGRARSKGIDVAARVRHRDAARIRRFRAAAGGSGPVADRARPLPGAPR